MLKSSEDGPQAIREGRSLFGPGWKAVDNFDDLSDIDEYESEEEETYVTLDLGAAVENKSLQIDTDYQLIGLDTPLPFLKLGNQIYQGDVASLVGDEVILGLRRNHDDPHNPSHPPLHKTNSRIAFRPVTLRPIAAQPDPSHKTPKPPVTEKKHPKNRKRILGAPDRRTGGYRIKGQSVQSDSDDESPIAGPSGSGSGRSRTGSRRVSQFEGSVPPADGQVTEVHLAADGTTEPIAGPSNSARPMIGDDQAPEMDIDDAADDGSFNPMDPPKKKKGRPKGPGQDLVINDLAEFQALDLAETKLASKAKIILSPAVDLSQIGGGLEESQRILTQADVTRIKSGKALRVKGGKKAQKRKEGDEGSVSQDVGDAAPQDATASGAATDKTEKESDATGEGGAKATEDITPGGGQMQPGITDTSTSGAEMDVNMDMPPVVARRGE